MQKHFANRGGNPYLHYGFRTHLHNRCGLFYQRCIAANHGCKKEMFFSVAYHTKTIRYWPGSSNKAGLNRVDCCEIPTITIATKKFYI